MPKICYQARRFAGKALARVETAIEIAESYFNRGYDLTLRQLFYQMVANHGLPNSQREYKNLGELVAAARLAGLIDWDHLTDRTRFLRSQPSWTDPASIVEACAAQFRLDKWADQPVRPEIWVEKDALVGVFESVGHELQVSVLSCRGYTSASELWTSAQRIIRRSSLDQGTVILHFGDHDPSGVDMTRDIRERLHTFRAEVTVKRIALHMDQVEAHNCPPNPVKLTDSRSPDYTERYGDESWELDALRPEVLAQLARGEVLALRHEQRFRAAVRQEEAMRKELKWVANDWEGAVKATRPN